MLVLTSYELWVSFITQVLSKLVLRLAGGLKGWTDRVHLTLLMFNPSSPN